MSPRPPPPGVRATFKLTEPHYRFGVEDPASAPGIRPAIPAPASESLTREGLSEPRYIQGGASFRRRLKALCFLRCLTQKGTYPPGSTHHYTPHLDTDIDHLHLQIHTPYPCPPCSTHLPAALAVSRSIGPPLTSSACRSASSVWMVGSTCGWTTS